MDGRRLNTSSVYLSKAVLARPNLTVRARVQVDRIEFGGTQTTGVRLVGGEVVAAQEVAISAGVYGSPAILLRPVSDLLNIYKSSTFPSWPIFRLESACRIGRCTPSPTF